MTAPWSAASVAPTPKMKQPRFHYSGNFTLRILGQFFAVGGLDGLHVQRTTSCIKPVTDFAIPVSRRRWKHRKTLSECLKSDVNNVAWLALTQKTDTHGEPVFDVAVLLTASNGTRTVPNNEYGWMDGGNVCILFGGFATYIAQSVIVCRMRHFSRNFWRLFGIIKFILGK